MSSNGKVTVAHRSARAGVLAVKLTCDQFALVELRATLIGTTRRYRVAPVAAAARAGTWRVLELKLPASAVRDLVRGASHRTARISRLRI